MDGDIAAALLALRSLPDGAPCPLCAVEREKFGLAPEDVCGHCRQAACDAKIREMIATADPEDLTKIGEALLDILHAVRCTRCDGTGSDPDLSEVMGVRWARCTRCNGDGYDRRDFDGR